MKRLAVCLGAGSLLLMAPAGAGITPDGAASLPVDDPQIGAQWGLFQVHAPAAWVKGTGPGVTIAVVDSGVDLGHEDLRDKVVAHVSCVGADDDPARCSGSGQDDHGHGTHVAGIAAAAANNARGVAGVAPDASIMAVKVLSADGDGNASGHLADVRAGIHWAVDHGADVVNLSLTEHVFLKGLFGSGLYSAIDYAWREGVIVAVASGNEASMFGNGYQGVDALVVTATDVNGDQADYAVDVGRARWGIAAPGGEKPEAGTDRSTQVLSTWWQPGHADWYGFMHGTSMAAPHVAGAAAVMLGLGLSPIEAVERLLDTATDVGWDGHDRHFGHGLLDLARATEEFETSAATVAASSAAPASPPAVGRSSAAHATGAPATNGPPIAAPPAPTDVTTTPPAAAPTPSVVEPGRVVSAPVPQPPRGGSVSAFALWAMGGVGALGFAALALRRVAGRALPP